VKCRGRDEFRMVTQRFASRIQAILVELPARSRGSSTSERGYGGSRRSVAESVLGSNQVAGRRRSAATPSVAADVGGRVRGTFTGNVDGIDVQGSAGSEGEGDVEVEA